MSDQGQRIDLTSDVTSRTSAPPSSADKPERAGRFLGVNFECCGVYGRVYPNRNGDAYEGRCPRCMSAIRVGIGPGGTSSRFFTAS